MHKYLLAFFIGLLAFPLAQAQETPYLLEVAGEISTLESNYSGQTVLYYQSQDGSFVNVIATDGKSVFLSEDGGALVEIFELSKDAAKTFKKLFRLGAKNRAYHIIAAESNDASNWGAHFFSEFYSNRVGNTIFFGSQDDEDISLLVIDLDTKSGYEAALTTEPQSCDACDKATAYSTTYEAVGTQLFVLHGNATCFQAVLYDIKSGNELKRECYGAYDIESSTKSGYMPAFFSTDAGLPNTSGNHVLLPSEVMFSYMRGYFFTTSPSSKELVESNFRGQPLLFANTSTVKGVDFIVARVALPYYVFTRGDREKEEVDINAVDQMQSGGLSDAAYFGNYENGFAQAGANTEYPRFIHGLFTVNLYFSLSSMKLYMLEEVVVQD